MVGSGGSVRTDFDARAGNDRLGRRPPAKICARPSSDGSGVFANRVRSARSGRKAGGGVNSFFKPTGNDPPKPTMPHHPPASPLQNLLRPPDRRRSRTRRREGRRRSPRGGRAPRPPAGITRWNHPSESPPGITRRNHPLESPRGPHPSPAPFRSAGDPSYDGKRSRRAPARPPMPRTLFLGPLP